MRRLWHKRAYICCLRNSKLLLCSLARDWWVCGQGTDDKWPYYMLCERLGTLSWQVMSLGKVVRRAMESFYLAYKDAFGDKERTEFSKRTKETSDEQFNLWVRKLPCSRNGRPLQYSCLENSMDRGAWWTTVHKVTESHITEWLITCNKVVLLNSKIHRAWVNAERRWRRGENRHQASFERRSHKRKLTREVNSCVSWCVWG